ncbi:MAG: hypothetical protein EOM87_00750 [Clostridia bacterium]|nr:hypothetical protein [Clostridia bacterium]
MEFLFIIIVIFGVILFAFTTYSRTAVARGALGELRVRIVIGKTKEGKKYVINNFMVVDEGKSSQIDHIVINQNGLFVIETKNYSGRIYGNENQQEWTQVLSYGKVKHKLYNPIKQNATHIYRINKLLSEKVSIKSLIVFVQNNTDYIQAADVIPLYALKRTLNKSSATVLTDEQMKNIYEVLHKAKANEEVSAKAHINNIKQMKLDIQNDICPRCGGKLLEKTGKYGTFFGCEKYPHCKFIRKSNSK